MRASRPLPLIWLGPKPTFCGPKPFVDEVLIDPMVVYLKGLWVFFCLSDYPGFHRPYVPHVIPAFSGASRQWDHFGFVRGFLVLRFPAFSAKQVAYRNPFQKRTPGLRNVLLHSSCWLQRLGFLVWFVEVVCSLAI